VAAQAISRCRKEVHEQEVAIGRTLSSFALHKARVLGWAAARLATVALVSIRLDGVVTSAWALTLAPLWALLLLELGIGSSGLKLPAGAGERETLLRQMSIGRLVLTSALGVLLLLLCLRLDGVMSSWLWIMLPLFVATGLYFCCCACLCCTLSFAPKPSAREVPTAPLGADLPTPADTDRSGYGQPPREGEPLLSAGKRGSAYGGTRSPPEEV